MSGEKKSAIYSPTPSDAISIKFVKQPPEYLIVNEWHYLEIKACYKKSKHSKHSSKKETGSSSKRSTENFNQHDDNEPIHVDIQMLKNEDKYSNRRNSNVILPILQTDPILPIKLYCGKNTKTERFRCKIESRDQGDNFSSSSYCLQIFPTRTRGQAIEPIFSKPFKIAICSLKIEANDWENIWFKDEGGREKCMQIDVFLCDSCGQIITNRSVPLQLTLQYESEQNIKVMRQEILHVFGPEKHTINPTTGKTSLRFRIEDVSKNHQGQNFVVKVEEYSSKYNGIAPALTPSVNIRSKRNKRQRSGGRSPSDAPFRNSALTSPLDGSQDGSESDHQQGNLNLHGYQDVQRLRDAMRGVIKWTEEVVNGLYPIQWKVIGYPSLPDGSYDYNHPYHSMPNPNPCIAKIIQMYSESTRENLKVLISAIENATNNDQTSLRRLGAMATATSAAKGATEEFRGFNQILTPPMQMTIRPSPLMESLDKQRRNFENQQVQSNEDVNYATRNRPHYGAFDPPPPWVESNVSPMKQGFNQDQEAVDRGMSYNTTNLHQDHRLGERYTNQLPASVPGEYPPFTSFESKNARRDDPLSQDVSISSTGMTNTSKSPTQRHNTTDHTMIRHGNENDETNDRQSEVAYVIAVQYVLPRSKIELGFPAYTKSKELLGFYRESKTKVGTATFIPVSLYKNEFSPIEMAQATQFLVAFIDSSSQAVHAIKDWGTVRTLVDHAMVYDWNNGNGTSVKNTPERGYT